MGVAADSTFEDALRAIHDVKGWLASDQARILYERAARLPAGARIVEIGSYHGRSTIVLAMAAPEAEIVAIDPYPDVHDGSAEPVKFEIGERDLELFEANLERAGVRERVRLVRDFSANALSQVEGSIDLLYVDGAHDLPSARGDIRAWGDRVPDGGTMLVHDAFSSVGVTIAQAVTLFFGSRFRYLGRSRSLAEYRREPVSGRARVVNGARQAASLPWFVRNVVVKVALVAKARPVARLLGHTDEVYPY